MGSGGIGNVDCILNEYRVYTKEWSVGRVVGDLRNKRYRIIQTRIVLK